MRASPVDALFFWHGTENAENVYSVLEQTDSGRYLVVIFINKPGNTALIITARDMDKKGRKRYERK